MAATVVRPATDADFQAFVGRKPPEIWLGMMAEREGRIVAMGVIAWNEDGKASGYFDAKERVSPLTIHKTALRMLAALKEAGEPVVFAGCDDMKVGARRWLKMLGFAYDGQVGAQTSRWKWESGA